MHIYTYIHALCHGKIERDFLSLGKKLDKPTRITSLKAFERHGNAASNQTMASFFSPYSAEEKT